MLDDRGRPAPYRPYGQSCQLNARNLSKREVVAATTGHGDAIKVPDGPDPRVCSPLPPLPGRRSLRTQYSGLGKVFKECCHYEDDPPEPGTSSLRQTTGFVAGPGDIWRLATTITFRKTWVVPHSATSVPRHCYG